MNKFAHEAEKNHQRPKTRLTEFTADELLEVRLE